MPSAYVLALCLLTLIYRVAEHLLTHVQRFSFRTALLDCYRSSVNTETGKVQQRLQFDASDIAYFERRLNELVLQNCLCSSINCV